MLNRLPSQATLLTLQACTLRESQYPVCMERERYRCADGEPHWDGSLSGGLTWYWGRRSLSPIDADDVRAHRHLQPHTPWPCQPVPWLRPWIAIRNPLPPPLAAETWGIVLAMYWMWAACGWVEWQRCTGRQTERIVRTCHDVDLGGTGGWMFGPECGKRQARRL
jgi:hypothetical protein